VGGQVLALVHGVSTGDRETVLGTLSPAIRRRGFDVTFVSFADGETAPPADGFDFICVTGSPDSVHDKSLTWIDTERRYLRDAIARGIPVFGMCFGAQILASALGGTVTRSSRPEHGYTTVRTTNPELIAPGPWMEFHDDTISVPADVAVIADNDAGVQAFTFGPHLGVQFHPEINEACFRSWRVDAEAEAGTGNYVDVEALAAEIYRRTEQSARACDQLLEGFLTHARVGETLTT
jgi:GMP synthase-like glutamine amidotransferase